MKQKISLCHNCKCEVISNNWHIRKYCDSCLKDCNKGKNNPMYGKPPVFKGMKMGNIQRQNKIIECYFNDKGCLISTNHFINPSGYPQIFRDGKAWILSRWVFYINFGYLPPIVMHTCDNSLCINPSHLIAGTIKENSHDMVRKGRSPKGLNQYTGGIKLNEEMVREIKIKLFKGQSLMSLAKEYSVSKRLILLIKQEKRWKHLQIPLN